MASDRWYPQGQTRPAIGGAWDTVILGGTALPGRARITRASAKWKIDNKRKPGSDADRPTKFGFESAPVGFEVEVITVDEKDLVDRALSFYVPAPGWSLTPVTISHPAIDHLPIKSIVIEEIGAWEDAGKGRKKISVSGRAWVGDDKPQAKGKKTETASKLPPNKRRDDAAKRSADKAGANPAPASQPGFCGPNFTPGA